MARIQARFKRFNHNWLIQVPVTINTTQGKLGITVNDFSAAWVDVQGRIDLWFEQGNVISDWRPDISISEPFASLPAGASSVVLGIRYDAAAKTFTTRFNDTNIETVDASQWIPTLGPHIGVTLYGQGYGKTAAGQMYFGQLTAVPEPSLLALLAFTLPAWRSLHCKARHRAT
ncbi:MAG: hypothetical protein IT424_03780 [Pirellulales bacterium]|nr:hypothetical protein [Pirellulales bacterium]